MVALVAILEFHSIRFKLLFYLLVGLLLYHKFRLNWQSRLRGIVENRFSDQHKFSYFQIAQLSKIYFQNGSYGGHFGFPIGIILAIFTYTTTCCYIVSFNLIRLVVCEMSKTDFQDGSRGGHLGFPINTTLANFDSDVVLLLQSKFQLISTKGLVTVVENGFSRWRP